MAAATSDGAAARSSTIRCTFPHPSLRFHDMHGPHYQSNKHCNGLNQCTTQPLGTKKYLCHLPDIPDIQHYRELMYQSYARSICDQPSQFGPLCTPKRFVLICRLIRDLPEKDNTSARLLHSPNSNQSSSAGTL